MKLYELSAELNTAIERYNAVETDEELETIGKTLTDLQITFNEKAVAVAKHVLSVDADVAAIDAEIERLSAMKKPLERQSEWFRAYLKNNMEATENFNVDGRIVKLKIQQNPPSVVIDDESKVPEKYKRTKTIVEVDKKAIKAAHDEGVGVDGTHIERKTRLVIK